MFWKIILWVVGAVAFLLLVSMAYLHYRWPIAPETPPDDDDPPAPTDSPDKHA